MTETVATPLSELFQQLLILCDDNGRAHADIPAFQGLQHEGYPVRVVTEPGSNAAFVYVDDEIVGCVVFTAPLPGDLTYCLERVPLGACVRIRFGAPGTDMSYVSIDSAVDVEDLARRIAATLATRLPAQAQGT